MYLFSHIMHLYSSNVPLESLLFKSKTQETLSWKSSRERWIGRGAGGNTHTLLFAQDDSIEVVCVFVRVCVRETEITRSNMCMALLCAGERD